MGVHCVMLLSPAPANGLPTPWHTPPNPTYQRVQLFVPRKPTIHARTTMPLHSSPDCSAAPLLKLHYMVCMEGGAICLLNSNN